MFSSDAIVDVALTMLKEKEALAFSRNGAGETALHLMARKPSAIAHKRQLNFFKSIANSSKLANILYAHVFSLNSN